MSDLLLPQGFNLTDLPRILNDRLRQVASFIEHVILSSDQDACGYRITNLADPVNNTDAVNLQTLHRSVSKFQVTQQKSTATAVTPSATTIQQQLVLSRSGILSISSSVFPLVQLPSARFISRIVAIGNQAPVMSGSEQLVFQINVAGSTVTTINVPNGATSAVKSGAGLPAIQANAAIYVAVTSVGLTFPGADWSLILELA
jgi:hypothetical protein